jgi:tRNA-2-methylthio-N6-dimethylallyladenosine synthase
MLETLCKTQISQNILDDKQKQQYIGKFFLKTYGCQMNEYDSQKMAKMVDELGLTKCNSIQDADLIIINTCHIREKATEKLYSELGRIRKTKKPEAKIVVAGCVAQAEGEEVIRRTEGLVELIIGPQSIHLLPGLVYKALSNQTFNPINLDFPGMDKFDVIPESQYNHGINGHLTIQEGCDKFCKFCCVPYTRGAEYSRPVEKIYREALILASNGVKTVNLLGQNVNAYHGLDENNNNCNLGRLLLEYISKIPQFVRIFYTTSHPNDMHDELYEAHRKIKNLIPFVHLPIQSGSNKILKDMNRKHTKEEYIEIINKLRENRPDIQFSTDIIVGYPGETDEDFQDTYDLVESVKYAQSYIFKYSPRIGTPAASRTDQVEKQVVDERFQRLKILVDKQQMEINKTFVEKKLEVLFEKINENNQLVGRSQYMQLVFANVTEDYDANMIGKIANVKITRAFGHSLLGDVV